MQITEDIDRLLDLGYNIATEGNFYTLFDMILDSCVKFTNADGGTLYIAAEGKLKHLLVGILLTYCLLLRCLRTMGSIGQTSSKGKSCQENCSDEDGGNFKK